MGNPEGTIFLLKNLPDSITHSHEDIKREYVIKNYLGRLRSKNSRTTLKAKEMDDGAISRIAPVDIDASGVFKYVLMRIHCKGEESYIVRGHAWAAFHDDIFQHHKLAIMNTPGVDRGVSA